MIRQSPCTWIRSWGTPHSKAKEAPPRRKEWPVYLDGSRSSRCKHSRRRYRKPAYGSRCVFPATRYMKAEETSVSDFVSLSVNNRVQFGHSGELGRCGKGTSSSHSWNWIVVYHLTLITAPFAEKLILCLIICLSGMKSYNEGANKLHFLKKEKKATRHAVQKVMSFGDFRLIFLRIPNTIIGVIGNFWDTVSPKVRLAPFTIEEA